MFIEDHPWTGIQEGYEAVVKSLDERYFGWEGTEQFQGTVRRLCEFCWSPDKIGEELDKETRLFDEKYGQVLGAAGIKVVSLCPHHLLPCEFTVDIQYKPNGQVLGLSKFTRIAVILGKRPVMQEMYTRELVDTLFDRINPVWVSVEVRGIHGCMKFRGPLQEVEVTTSMLKGSLDQ